MSHPRQLRRGHVDAVRHLPNQILPNGLRNHSILWLIIVDRNSECDSMKHTDSSDADARSYLNEKDF